MSQRLRSTSAQRLLQNGRNFCAVGLLQILDGPSDPEANIAAGAALFAQHMRTYGDLDLALAAYNAGPGAVRTHGGVPPYDETRWHGYLTRYWYWAFTQSDT